MVGSGHAWLGLDSARRRFDMLGCNELSQYGGIGLVYVIPAVIQVKFKVFILF